MLVLLLSLGLVFVDQASKYWITSGFSLGESVPVIPGCFNLTYVRNTGAAWGTFGGSTGLLTALSVVVLLALIVFRRSFLTDSFVHRVALAFMISGITGNLFDRIRLCYVVDFFDFYWGSHHFAVFNVADAAICAGVGLYILSTLFTSRNTVGS